jgi:hypothetical protein
MTPGLFYTKLDQELNTKVEENSPRFAEVISLNIQNILFTLEENAIHQRYKRRDPGMVPNPKWLGPPTYNPRQHRWKEEEARHLHTGDNKWKT